MTHQLFYEGRLLGGVLNPLNSQNHFWLCQCCGRTFAVRIAPKESDPLAGPLRSTFWESLCARCARSEDLWPHQYEFLLAQFHRGGDASDQLPTLRAQFLYESEILCGS